MKNKLILFIICFSLSYSFSQNYFIKYINTEIEIDGVEDKLWSEVNGSSDYWQWRPSDSIKAKNQTNFKALYDDENLYFLIKSNISGDKFTVYSLKRDFETASADYVQLIFDTFSDATNAFQFQTNHIGLKGDLLVSNGNRDPRLDRNKSWDAIWYVESKLYDDFFLTELKIPLDQLYYGNNSKKWRFNMYRSDTNAQEHSVWSKVPQNQSIGNLAFMGNLIFEEPLGKQKKPFVLIPYINVLNGKEFIHNNIVKRNQAGVDIKIPIANSLNLDFTLNPDFSQVEVDDRIVNTSQWEIKLPEKRQFFTQNSDLFSDFGTSRDAQPFFSRRIGISSNKDGELIENKIISGIKLSGKINDKTRIGLLNILTDDDIENEIAQNNNTLLTFRKNVFNGSNFSFFFLNRESVKEYSFLNNKEKYNRVLGGEYNLASGDGKWFGKAFVHKSFRPSEINNKQNISSGIMITRNTNKSLIMFYSAYVGDDFRSDLGYYRRYGMYKFEPNYRFRIYPNNPKIQEIELSHYAAWVFRTELENKYEGNIHYSQIQLNYLSTSRLSFQRRQSKTYLYYDFDPTRSLNGKPLPKNNFYDYVDYIFSYKSSSRNIFNIDSSVSYGGFFNGNKFSFYNELAFRRQPIFNTSLKFNFDSIKLPSPYSSKDIWLISPKFEFTFSKKTFWTTYIQYSSQSEDLGINSRLQFRFAPLSDLYLVYNDNYYASNSILPRFRSINLKLTYWFNI
ncbi:MAG: DUF5916 domain-containing protein [Candidatus Marisimplicoccus sp.]